jgi:hypothetical protein
VPAEKSLCDGDVLLPRAGGSLLTIIDGLLAIRVEGDITVDLDADDIAGRYAVVRPSALSVSISWLLASHPRRKRQMDGAVAALMVVLSPDRRPGVGHVAEDPYRPIFEGGPARAG